jgi:hypothetical protein
MDFTLFIILCDFSTERATCTIEELRYENQQQQQQLQQQQQQIERLTRQLQE